MLADEIGMRTDEVAKIMQKIETHLNNEDKIYHELEELSSKTKNAYKSSNANLINSNNKKILESCYMKKTNLRSYKKYVDKYIQKYLQTTEQSIEMIQQTTASYNKTNIK